VIFVDLRFLISLLFHCFEHIALLINDGYIVPFSKTQILPFQVHFQITVSKDDHLRKRSKYSKASIKSLIIKC
jgi:hypothetical protein